VLYFAHPVKEYTEEKIQKNGIDIEVVLDLSYSMIAEDLPPSRIEVAKKVLYDFVWELESDRVGIILFSWRPFHSMPLSFEYDFLQSFIEEIDVEIIDQSKYYLAGTAMWDALILAGDNLEKYGNPDGEKIIILLTDGEANKGIDPIEALKFLKSKGIKTYTIWVGKDDITTVTIPDPVSGFVQKVQVWGIDEETLQVIAKQTGGKYYRADSEVTLQEIFEDISRLEKTQIEIEYVSVQDSLRGYVLLLLSIVLWMTVSLFLFKPIRL